MKIRKSLDRTAIDSLKDSDYGVIRPALSEEELQKVSAAGSRLCGGTDTCLALLEL